MKLHRYYLAEATKMTWKRQSLRRVN